MKQGIARARSAATVASLSQDMTVAGYEEDSATPSKRMGNKYTKDGQLLNGIGRCV